MRPPKSTLTLEYYKIRNGSSLLEKRIELLRVPEQSLQLVRRATLFSCVIGSVKTMCSAVPLRIVSYSFLEGIQQGLPFTQRLCKIPLSVIHIHYGLWIE